MIPRIAQWRPERFGLNVILADTTGTRAGPGAPPAGPPRPSFEPEPRLRRTGRAACRTRAGCAGTGPQLSAADSASTGTAGGRHRPATGTEALDGARWRSMELDLTALAATVRHDYRRIRVAPVRLRLRPVRRADRRPGQAGRAYHGLHPTPPMRPHNSTQTKLAVPACMWWTRGCANWTAPAKLLTRPPVRAWPASSQKPTTTAVFGCPPATNRLMALWACHAP